MENPVADQTATDSRVDFMERRRPGRRDDIPSSLIPLMRRDQLPGTVAVPEDDGGVIFIIGAPRSGTTWLAKILDSHPDVVYRHEPDEWLPSPHDLDETNVHALVDQWISDRSLRTSTKRPFFPKSWQTTRARLLRATIAYTLRGLPLASDIISQLPVPDLGAVEKARVVIKTVRWCDGIGIAARALPSSRTLLIMRQPCAQVHSVMRGAQDGKFQLRGGGDLPLDQIRAMACAAPHGIDSAEFLCLPEAAKYAWGWAAFNQTVEASLFGLPNVRIVRYEDLCENPERGAREAMAFAGLTWNAQTADFVHRSASHSGSSAFYGVFQNAATVSQRWRNEMTDEDRCAVEGVAHIVFSARCWSAPHAERRVPSRQH
jgi:hypothetical protein